MLTDPKLRLQVDTLWDFFWTGEFTYLYEPPLDMFGADANAHQYILEKHTSVGILKYDAE